MVKATYCGAGKSNKPTGTATECVDNKQLRLYGLKKVPKEVLEQKKVMNTKNKLSRDLRENQVEVTAMLRKATKLIKDKERILKIKEYIPLLDSDDIFSFISSLYNTLKGLP